VQRVNADVGGITYLGELNKAQLYKEISEAAVMWYPGVYNFAETNCIAAMEANACGTPLVGSLKGALVETAKPSFDAHLLIPGNAEKDEAYQQASMAAVANMLAACKDQTFAYRSLQRQGRELAKTCDYQVLAREWADHVNGAFDRRLETNAAGILRQLVHEDDYTAVKMLATALDDAPMVQQADDVIHGRCVTAADYAKDAIQDPLYEAEHCARFPAVAVSFKDCTRVLDVACGNGSFALVLAKMNPTVHVHGIDYSAGNIAAARAAAEKMGVADRCTFEQVTVYDFEQQTLDGEWLAFAERHAGAFDGLFSGEFIEHVAEVATLVDGLESVVKTGGPIVYTCPSGAFGELADRTAPRKFTHVHRFHHDDVRAVFGEKRDLRADYLSVGWSRRGMPLGNWMIRYTCDHDRPAHDRPLQERIRKTRPMAKLSVGIITKNAENDLGRCLASIWMIADEIVVGDTGSTDRTVEIAKDYGATILTLAPIEEQREGFAGARNAVLQACTGDWFCWIDADEVLAGSAALRRYLDGPVYNGFVIHQNHLQLDAPKHYDIPTRVFRRVPQIQFYGCVHEQPQWNDANTDIHPTLDVQDVQIAHTGYLTEGVRRDKMMHRNLPLIIKDQEVFPDRMLGKVIVLRESVLQANRQRETSGGQMTPAAYRSYLYALRVFREYFREPGHKFEKIARPWYEQALQALDMGWEVELALAGRKGGLENRSAKPERIWVADAEELAGITAQRTKEVAEKMRPTAFHTDPFTVDTPEREAMTA
jgi:glycosyltransferase involved in cell wall biosynthesis/2-polyprenyl-3-methyl-5-hydroxy-6-metoxy-1,4-benzoquinol methylase